MKQKLPSLAAGVAAACLVLSVPHAQRPSDARVGARAYYLFLAQPPKGCEDCYVPLLVTTRRLEEVAKEKADEQSVLITTYERDSIVGAPRGVTIAPAAISPQERKVRVLDRRYRYQEVGASEVLTLLERPGGTIPISRIPQMRVPSVDELADVTTRFRGLK